MPGFKLYPSEPGAFSDGRHVYRPICRSFTAPRQIGFIRRSPNFPKRAGGTHFDQDHVGISLQFTKEIVERIQKKNVPPGMKLLAEYPPPLSVLSANRNNLRLRPQSIS